MSVHNTIYVKNDAQVGGNITVTGTVDGINIAAHDTATTGVHGVGAGAIVGTTLTQTLTAKTLISPAIGTSILDTNGNELVLLTATASAVNELTLANAATASNPLLSATGGDANIGIEFRTKGTGTHIFDNDTAAAEIRLQDAAGTNYIGIKPAAATTSYTLTMPATQGAANEILTNNGSGVLSWVAGGGQVIYNTSFATTFSTVATSWLKIVDFIYPGSVNVGSLTSAIIIARKDASVTNYRFRIQDLTNSLTIATSALQTNTTNAFIDIVTFSNVPTSTALLEIDIEVTGGTGGSKSAYVEAIMIRS